MPQIKFSFDSLTVKKIVHGATIAATASVALYILAYVGTVQISDPALAAVVAWAVPTLTNAVKEWAAGE